MELKSIIINASKASLDMYLEDTTKPRDSETMLRDGSIPSGACEKEFCVQV
jgi:hypothetical protein